MIDGRGGSGARASGSCSPGVTSPGIEGREMSQTTERPLINVESHEPGSAKGIYHLVIHLSQSRDIAVGRLGWHFFPRGYYVYTGSALSGLGARLNRHLREGKRDRWHIDYLLRAGRLTEIWYRVTGRRLECTANQAIANMPGAREVVCGFGSSDCRCRTHLWHFRVRPRLDRSRFRPAARAARVESVDRS